MHTTGSKEVGTRARKDWESGKMLQKTVGWILQRGLGTASLTQDAADRVLLEEEVMWHGVKRAPVQTFSEGVAGVKLRICVYFPPKTNSYSVCTLNLFSLCWIQSNIGCLWLYGHFYPHFTRFLVNSTEPFLFLTFFFIFRCQAGWFCRLHNLWDCHVVTPPDTWPAGQLPVHVLRPVRLRPPLFLLKRSVLDLSLTFRLRATLLSKGLTGDWFFLWWLGIPFMYRGLPCIYSSAILASASLLSGGNMALLRVIAMAMIVFMISQNFYPHDRVLESQAWKKAVYAGGKVILKVLTFLSSKSIAVENDYRAEIHLHNTYSNDSNVDVKVLCNLMIIYTVTV